MKMKPILCSKGMRQNRGSLNRKKKVGFTRIVSQVPNAFQWLVFDKIGLYATSPGRVLLSVVVFWIFFGMIYFTLAVSGLGQTMSSVNNPDNLSVLMLSFYHSAVTFLQ